MTRFNTRLVIVCVICIFIIGTFVYKFKYERMKLIVEGAGLDEAPGYSHLISVPEQNGSTTWFERPSVTWNNISNHFVFSAFPCDDPTPYQVHRRFCAIGYGPDTETNYKCNVWFDLGRELSSISGTFTYESLPVDGSPHLFYEFKCHLSDVGPPHRQPYILQLKTPDLTHMLSVPIFKPKRKPSTNRFVVCLLPDVVNEWESMVEFVAFHEVIGITDIIVYDTGNNYGFWDKMKSIIQFSPGSLKSLSVLRWDFPGNLDPISNFLIEKDCLYRSYDFSNLTVILNWNQFFVPINGGLLEDFSGTNKNIIYSQITQLRSSRCCTDFSDDHRSEKSYPIALKKTLCLPNEEPYKVYINPTLTQIEFTLAKRSLVMAEVLSYSSCKGLTRSKAVPVFIMWNYSSKLLSSNILNLWNVSNLFSFKQN